LRLFLWINPAVDFLIAITKIPTMSYLIFTSIVFIPSTAMQVVIATLGINFITHLPTWAFIVLGTAIALAIVVVMAIKRRSASQGSESGS